MDPLFSVVLPTRNRAHLLRYSLQSALEQRFDDFEVLVSDNGSDRRAEAVVRAMADPRLRYVRTGADLSMPDSWEFALSHARGRYVTYLCDDDALLPSALFDVARVLLEADRRPELMSWSGATYAHPSWFKAEERNKLFVPAFTGEVQEHDSRAGLADLYGLRLEHPRPLMLNSMCSRSLLQAVERRAGRVFVGPAPDYSFAASSLAASRSFLHLDRPLMVNGSAQESIGMSHLYGDTEAVGRFVSEFGAAEVLPDVPIPLLTGQNVILQSLINVRRRTGGRPEDEPAVDLVRYFLATYQELRVWEHNGVDVGPAMRTFRRALEAQPDAVRRAVRRPLRGGTARRLLRRWIAGSHRLSRLEARVRPRLRALDGAIRVFDGAEHGFDDILGCVRRFDALVPAPSPGADVAPAPHAAASARAATP